MKKLILFRLLFFVTLIICSTQCQKQYQPGLTKTAGVVKSSAITSGIIYTDISPDTELYKSGSVYNLDINNDGITDYTISNNCASVKLTCLGNNEVLVDSSLRTLSALSSKVSIGANLKVWKDTSALISYYTWQYGGCGPGASGCIDYRDHGPFPNQVAAFLGLRVHKGSNIYYAWARITTRLPYVSIKSAGLRCYAVYIQDYAYNSRVGQTILSGQTQ